MALFPIAPRHAKMLIIGRQHGCLPYTIGIVSALSVGDPFMRVDELDGGKPASENDAEEDAESDPETIEEELKGIRSQDVVDKERRKLQRRRYYAVQAKHSGLDPSSDILKILNAIGAYEYVGATEKFCEENFLRAKVSILSIYYPFFSFLF